MAKEKNKEVVRIVKEMKKAEVKMLRGDKWQVKKDLVLKEGNIYILEDKKLRIEIILLQLRNLSVGLGEEPCIGFI